MALERVNDIKLHASRAKYAARSAVYERENAKHPKLDSRMKRLYENFAGGHEAEMHRELDTLDQIAKGTTT
jgi:hypothetical protein